VGHLVGRPVGFGRLRRRKGKRQGPPPEGRRESYGHAVSFRAKEVRPPERRLLDTDSGKWFSWVAILKRGFRDGDVSGAFFFASKVPSSLEKYASRIRAALERRVDLRELPDEPVAKFGNVPTLDCQPDPALPMVDRR
jgi:hypothetical protein